MHTPRLIMLALALSTTVAAGTALAQTQTSSPAMPAAGTAPATTTKGAAISSRDRKFVNTAAEAGAAEVAMGKLAEARASSTDVKDFAARMVSDHGKAGEELKAIATAKGVTPVEQLSAKDEAALDKLGKLQGIEFDKAYVKGQLAAHKGAVALFGTESKRGKDKDLKQFASSTLPTLQDHLQMVQQLSKAPIKTSRASDGAMQRTDS